MQPMPQNKSQTTTNELHGHPTLCNWSKLFCASVWERIGFCRTAANMNVYETSITQELLFQFWQLARNSELPIELYQSKDEKANGNDLEIGIGTKYGYFLVPCQAKIVSKKSNYAAFLHKVNSVYQLDILLTYGKRVKGLPLYLMYNFNDISYQNQTIESFHSLDIRELGCSLHPAALLKTDYSNALTGKLSIPNFYDLHRKTAIPFSRLFCTVGTTQILKETKTSLSEISFYPKRELINSNYWQDLAPPAAIGRIPPFEELRFTQSPPANTTSFNPRFRILLSVERRPGGRLFRN
jgi:hypothetical protein